MINKKSERITNANHIEKMINELSSYELKKIQADRTVKTVHIQNDYFLKNDVWNYEELQNDLGLDANSNQMKKRKYDPTTLEFKTVNPLVRLELKYLCFKQFFNDKWTWGTIVVRQKRCMKIINKFLIDKYPQLNSLLDLDIEKATIEWNTWLVAEGYSLTREVKTRGKVETVISKSQESSFLENIIELLEDYLDGREEWDKDKWDIRKLDKFGIKRNKASARSHYLNFAKINNYHFREISKEYIKQRLVANNRFSTSNADGYLNALVKFFNLLSNLEPDWKDLSKLERRHILKYLEYLRSHTAKFEHKKSNPDYYIRQSIIMVNKFLDDLQFLQNPKAPTKPIRQLIHPQDKPNLSKRNNNKIKHIPDIVLEQLFANLSKLPEEIQAVILIMAKTGLRISDALGLDHNCLFKVNDKYHIMTDIEKTNTINHIIPIDEQLANVIGKWIDHSIKFSNQDNNPHNFIFISKLGKRKGYPIAPITILSHLNDLAIDNNITDESGKLWHFSNHQFRHTYAVKMINSGVDIVTIQQLLAHTSPEMTLRYAKLNDESKRKAFETLIKNNVYTFGANNEVIEVEIDGENIPSEIVDALWSEHKLNAIDNPYGTCHARLNGDCPIAEEPPCLTCNGGSPCKDLAIGFSDLDVNKYELLIQSTTKAIDILTKNGREDVAEKNKQNLKRYKDILQTIKSNKVIFGRQGRIKGLGG